MWAWCSYSRKPYSGSSFHLGVLRAAEPLVTLYIHTLSSLSLFSECFHHMHQRPLKHMCMVICFYFLPRIRFFFFRPWLQICSYDWLCSPVPGDHKWITNRAYIPKLYFISKYSITDLSKLSIIKLEGAGPGPPVCIWNIYLYYVKFEKVLYIYWQTWVHDFKGCKRYMSKHASKQVAIGYYL